MASAKKSPNTSSPHKAKYDVRLEKAQRILAKYGDIDLSSTLREMRKHDALKEEAEHAAYTVEVRLTRFEIASIIYIFKQKFLPHDKLWLFGSRADMNQKGGDIDLYVQTNIIDYNDAFDKKRSFLIELKNAIGDQKIDLVLDLGNKKLAIYDVARNEGVRLV